MSTLKLLSKLFAVSALSVALVASAKADPVLTNGSFETSTNGTGELGYNTAVTGWSSSGYNFLFSPSTATTTGSAGQYGNVSLYPGSAPGAVLGASPSGGNFIGMDGAFQTGPLSQTITGLTVGQVTNVSFYYAGAQQSGYTGTTTEAFNVSLGNQTLSTPTLTDSSQGFTGWKYITLSFTATSTSELLSFMAVGTPNGEPPFSLLDGVTVQNAPLASATPEPNSLLLLGSGLAGTAFLLRRRFA